MSFASGGCVFYHIALYPDVRCPDCLQEFFANLGIWGSPWIGFDRFERFFNSYYFWRLLKNTLVLSAYQLILFPLPIILALSLHEVRNRMFKKWAQTLTYAPHFISVVVVVGMIVIFLDPTTGLVNRLIVVFGGSPIDFLTSPGWFRHILHGLVSGKRSDGDRLFIWRHYPVLIRNYMKRQRWMVHPGCSVFSILISQVFCRQSLCYLF